MYEERAKGKFLLFASINIRLKYKAILSTDKINHSYQKKKFEAISFLCCNNIIYNLN